VKITEIASERKNQNQEMQEEQENAVVGAREAMNATVKGDEKRT